jgi:hypothetical protein
MSTIKTAHRAAHCTAKWRTDIAAFISTNRPTDDTAKHTTYYAAILSA